MSLHNAGLVATFRRNKQLKIQYIMAETNKKEEEGILIISIGLRPGELAGYGKITVGKENPKVLDFREDIKNNHKKE